MSHLSILVDDNQSPRVFRALLRDLVTNISYSFIHPGGCNELKFSVPVTRKYPIDIERWVGFNFEVCVQHFGKVVWCGRLEDFNVSVSRNGIVYNVTAKGYGVNLDDQEYTSEDIAGLQTSTVFSNAIDDLTEQIDVKSITASGYTLAAAAPVTVKLQTAAQIAHLMQLFGNSSDQDIVWYIEPDNDGTIRVTWKPRPTTPDYETYLTEFVESGFGILGRQLANIVDVEYNNSASFVTRQDTTLQAAGPSGFGIKKTRRLSFPEVVNSTDANQLGDRALASWSQAKMNFSGLQLPGRAFVWDANKHKMDIDEIKAGRIMRLVDILPTRYPLSNISLSNEFLIAETEWDEDAQMLTVTPESFDTQLESTVARERVVLGGRHTV